MWRQGPIQELVEEYDLAIGDVPKQRTTKKEEEDVLQDKSTKPFPDSFNSIALYEAQGSM